MVKWYETLTWSSEKLMNLVKGLVTQSHIPQKFEPLRTWLINTNEAYLEWIHALIINAIKRLVLVICESQSCQP